MPQRFLEINKTEWDDTLVHPVSIAGAKASS